MERISVLVVETDKAVLFMYRDLINSQNPGFDRFFVDNADKAKELIELRKFNILAVNYRLASSNNETGITIATKFREKNPKAPIVILSSLISDAQDEAKKNGLTNKVLFIRKPVIFSDLSKKLEKFLGIVPW